MFWYDDNLDSILVNQEGEGRDVLKLYIIEFPLLQVTTVRPNSMK